MVMVSDTKAVINASKVKNGIPDDLNLIQKHHHWSLVDMAKHFGVRKSTICYWKSGQVTPSGFNMIWIHEYANEIRTNTNA